MKIDELWFFICDIKFGSFFNEETGEDQLCCMIPIRSEQRGEEDTIGDQDVKAEKEELGPYSLKNFRNCTHIGREVRAVAIVCRECRWL